MTSLFSCPKIEVKDENLKGAKEMPESSKEDIIVMAIFMVTRDDVLTCAKELGIPEEQVTDDVIELVKEKVSQGLRGWREVIKSMVKETIKCPLGIVCSASCAWREVGECILPRGVK